jgi:hypothetical protein
MNDLRSQINSLSAAEKAELLDAVWESLEADAVSLTDGQRAEFDYRITGMSKTLPMSSRGSKSGRGCLRELGSPSAAKADAKFASLRHG